MTGHATDAQARLTTALADRYRIQSELGQGGMATVYLAHDLKHERDVAIKVLHPDLGAALGGERFLSEIRTTARLQHPHILPLLDSGDADGLLYYVMPLVTGETLRARLDRETQLPVASAVRIAREVADALHYAHSNGVIHRDIKPENILLQDGHALVADFGIALAVQSAGGQRMTQTGLSLGTPQYMSPEQAMGERTVDARSDIYALGAVTYEMLVGEAPFTGPTVQAVVARLLSEEPRSVVAQRKAVPDIVEYAVLRSLEKLPADRWATAREFSDALQSQSVSGASTSTASRHTSSAPGAAHRSRWRDPVVFALGAVALASVGLTTWMYRHSLRPTDAPVMRFTIPAPPRGENVSLGLSALAISRDGTMLAYVGQGADRTSQIFVRALDDVIAHAVAGTENADSPTFSPDGKSLAYIRASQLYRVPLAGGEPERLGALPGTNIGISWSARGSVVVSSNNAMYLFPETGGAPKRLVEPSAIEGGVYQLGPLVFDDEGVVFFSSWNDGNLANARLAMASLSTGETTVFDVTGTQPLGVIDQQLIYVSANGVITAVPIDVAKRRISGAPRQFVTGVTVNNTTGLAQAAFAANGTLFYLSGNSNSKVVLRSMDGSTTTFSDALGDYGFPRVSPNGQLLAITEGVSARRDVWVYDMNAKSKTRLTTSGTTNERPEWSPDGTRVMFRTDQTGGRSGFWWRPVDLSAEASVLLASNQLDVFEAGISPDGQYIAYQLDTSNADLYYRALKGDTTTKPIANSKFLESMQRISPDGRWIAFVSDESGSNQVVVQPFPGPGGRTAISAEGGTEPVWSPNSKHLYYRGSGKLMSATYRDNPTFSVVKRDTVFTDDFVFAANPHANYDVMRDGKRFVLLMSANEGELMIVTNFRKLLRDKIAGSVVQ